MTKDELILIENFFNKMLIQLEKDSKKFKEIFENMNDFIIDHPNFDKDDLTEIDKTIYGNTAYTKSQLKIRKSYQDGLIHSIALSTNAAKCAYEKTLEEFKNTIPEQS